MRLNAVPPSSVTRPGASSEVGEVAAARSIGAQASGAVLATPQGPSEQSAAAQTQAPTVERRRLGRRGDDRREQKLPILLEMRVGPRRTARRRAGDEAPPSVDTKA
jgi:hypothetical protein